MILIMANKKIGTKIDLLTANLEIFLIYITPISILLFYRKVDGLTSIFR